MSSNRTCFPDMSLISFQFFIMNFSWKFNFQHSNGRIQFGTSNDATIKQLIPFSSSFSYTTLAKQTFIINLIVSKCHSSVNQHLPLQAAITLIQLKTQQHLIKKNQTFLESIKFALIQMKDINTAYKIENQTAGQRE